MPTRFGKDAADRDDRERARGQEWNPRENPRSSLRDPRKGRHGRGSPQKIDGNGSASLNRAQRKGGTTRGGQRPPCVTPHPHSPVERPATEIARTRARIAGSAEGRGAATRPRQRGAREGPCGIGRRRNRRRGRDGRGARGIGITAPPRCRRRRDRPRTAQWRRMTPRRRPRKTKTGPPALLLSSPALPFVIRGNSTKPPSPRMDPTERPTDPGRRN